MIATQVLTAEQMRAAEQAVFDAGTSVSELMETAGGGAAEWIRRLAGGRSVTILCGPGNNGGDGYVIARRLRDAGNKVQVIAPLTPVTDAARIAQARWGGMVAKNHTGIHGHVLVDCLFGSGLARPLSDEHAAMLVDLALRHPVRIAIDLPSGIASDTGDVLNEGLPDYDLTLALGAWKFAHWTMPGRLKMGQMRCVPIAIAKVNGAAQLIDKPDLALPDADSHKYRRGLVAVIAGIMPGACMLAAIAAQRAGAGYVKLLGEPGRHIPPEIVCDAAPLSQALHDTRINAVLIGPGLGRDGNAGARLYDALASRRPVVLDADALMLLTPEMLSGDAPILATPHDGELKALSKAFGVSQENRRDVVLATAKASGMVICAKGPDTIIAAPDGRLALAPPASSWLSVAGSGDVLAGIAASRMATGFDPFTSACQAVWLHGAAARLSGAAFTPSELACNVAKALTAAL